MAAAAAAIAVRDRFLATPAFSPYRIIAGSWPIGGELDVRPLLAALSADRRTALPVVTGAGQPLRFRAWAPGDATVPDGLAIPTPPPDAETVVPDLVLVPLVAFDRRGHRLGQGGGFYDRTLQALRDRAPVLAVGVGFAIQELAAVPCDPHDQPLDWIVTERFAIKIG